jgi:hypothetical protein
MQTILPPPETRGDKGKSSPQPHPRALDLGHPSPICPRNSVLSKISWLTNPHPCATLSLPLPLRHQKAAVKARRGSFPPSRLASHPPSCSFAHPSPTLPPPCFTCARTPQQPTVLFLPFHGCDTQMPPGPSPSIHHHIRPRSPHAHPLTARDPEENKSKNSSPEMTCSSPARQSRSSPCTHALTGTSMR